MNRRMPATAGIDQLSLNLSVTRPLGPSVLPSVLLWPPGILGGGITTGGFFFLTGCWRLPGVWPNVEALPWLL